MVYARKTGFIGPIARVFRDGTLAGLSDREILERFVDTRDETAFEGKRSAEPYPDRGPPRQDS